MPYTKSRESVDYHPNGVQRSRIMERFWNIQRPPFREPLEYAFNLSQNSGAYFVFLDGTTKYLDASSWSVGGSSYDLIPDLINSCYERFVGATGEVSQNANNLLEARQSVGTVEARCLQLGSFVSALRQGKLSKAAGILGLGGVPPKLTKGAKGKAKSFANQFLEYHFGWAPALQDIHNSVSTMSNADFGSQRIDVHRHGKNQPPVVRHEIFTGDPPRLYYYDLSSQTNSFSVKMGARVKISNPNAFLANKMGVVNPLSIAWEAVPYSFVADWFGNVGQCLSAMTDFVGLEVTGAYTTTSTEVNYQYDAYNFDNNPSKGGSGSVRGKGLTIHRGGGIAGPTLRLKPFSGFSPVRAATAISLLLQKL